ncbi:MAG: hypothetical protein V3V40_05325, partial [Nitrosomonadaceae bacterium]
MEGRQMVMVLSPKKKEVKIAKPKETKPREIKPNTAEKDSDTTQDTKNLETNYTIETKTTVEKL